MKTTLDNIIQKLESIRKDVGGDVHVRINSKNAEAISDIKIIKNKLAVNAFTVEDYKEVEIFGVWNHCQILKELKNHYNSLPIIRQTKEYLENKYKEPEYYI